MFSPKNKKTADLKPKTLAIAVEIIIVHKWKFALYRAA